MRDLAGKRNVTRAVEQAAVVAVSAPRQQTGGKIIRCVELEQLLQHAMSGIFFGSEVGEGEITDLASSVGFLQKAQRFFFSNFIQLSVRTLGITLLTIAKINEDVDRRR